MGCLRNAAIEGFNEFLQAQQKAEGEAWLTLIQFDDQYEVWARAVPVREVKPLDHSTYQPRGSTALLDAIGRTIDEAGRRLAELPEAERPGKVIVAIMTDGLENASARYSHREIAKMIAHQRSKYSWEFLFLGANQDAIATASSLNISARDAATYAPSAAGTSASYRAMSRKMASMRAMAAGAAGPDLDAAHKPMKDLLKEEEEKGKGKGKKG